MLGGRRRRTPGRAGPALETTTSPRYDGVWALANPERDDSFLGSFQFGVDGISMGDEHLLSAHELAQLHHEGGAAFMQLQEKLVKNFKIRTEQGSIGWLRS